jgi:hypothetical protein
MPPPAPAQDHARLIDPIDYEAIMTPTATQAASPNPVTGSCSRPPYGLGNENLTR